MTPYFALTANSQDVTELIRERLISLRVTDESGMTSDTITLSLDDRDHKHAWPEHGAQLECFLGYRETSLTRVGTYVVDELSHGGPPATLGLHGKALDMRAEFKAHKTRSWDNVTVDTIVQTIAAEHHLTPKVSLALASILLLHIDQTDESDLHFLTRIANDFGGVVKPVNGFLLFVNKGESKSVSGQQIPPVTIFTQDILTYRMTLADRGKYASVRTFYQNTDAAELVEVLVGEGKPTYTLRHPHTSAEEAAQKGRAKLTALQRGTATLSLSVIGNLDLRAEGRLNIAGIRQPVDGEWGMTRVEHSLSASGLVTTVDAEIPTR